MIQANPNQTSVGEPDYFHEDWLLKSMPMNAEHIRPAQWVERKSVKYFDLMDNFKLGFTLFASYLAVVLAAVLACFWLNELKHKIEFGVWRRARVRTRRVGIRKRIAWALSKFGMNRLSTVGIFVLFFHLFVWFTTLFLINNIKTNKVVRPCVSTCEPSKPPKTVSPLLVQVVDTSELIKNEEDIFSTNRVACFLKDEQEMKIAESSATNNLLTRIFRERTLFRTDQEKEKKILGTDRCILEINERIGWLTNSQIFLIASKLHLSYLVALTNGLELARNLWISSQTIHQFNLVIYYNLRNSFNRDYFSKL